MKTYIQHVTGIKVSGNNWLPLFEGSKLTGIEATEGAWVDIAADGADSNFRFKAGDQLLCQDGTVSIVTTQ